MLFCFFQSQPKLKSISCTRLRQDQMDHIVEVMNFHKACVERFENELIDARLVAYREASQIRALILAENNAARAAKFSAEEAMNLAL